MWYMLGRKVQQIEKSKRECICVAGHSRSSFMSVNMYAFTSWCVRRGGVAWGPPLRAVIRAEPWRVREPGRGSNTRAKQATVWARLWRGACMVRTRAKRGQELLPAEMLFFPGFCLRGDKEGSQQTRVPSNQQRFSKGGKGKKKKKRDFL